MLKQLIQTQQHINWTTTNRTTESSVVHFIGTWTTTRRMAIANWTCVSWVAYAPGTITVNVRWIEREFNVFQMHRSMYTPIFNRLRAIARYWSEIATFSYPLHLTPPYGVATGTIAVNVTRLERGFNACKTPRCIYPSIFNRFPVIQAWILKIRHFSTFLHILAFPVYAPGTIAVSVTQLERGFNACKTPSCIYPSIFNRFPVIQAWSLKIRHFSTFFAHFGLPCVRLWDNRGKCHTVGKRIQCL